MKDLEKQQEVTFTSNGEGFISQVSLYTLLGMADTTFRRELKKVADVKLNDNNQIHEDSLFNVVEFMARRLKAKVETKDFLS